MKKQLTSSLTPSKFDGMRIRDNQNFLSLYYDPATVETAVGDADGDRHSNGWKGETKSLGQVETPQPVAALMARWVMSARPATVLDPAAGLGTLLRECRGFDVGVR